jgi:hypothetical protein
MMVHVDPETDTDLRISEQPVAESDEHGLWRDSGLW